MALLSSSSVGAGPQAILVRIHASFLASPSTLHRRSDERVGGSCVESSPRPAPHPYKSGAPHFTRLLLLEVRKRVSKALTSGRRVWHRGDRPRNSATATPRARRTTHRAASHHHEGCNIFLVAICIRGSESSAVQRQPLAHTFEQRRG